MNLNTNINDQKSPTKLSYNGNQLNEKLKRNIMQQDLREAETTTLKQPIEIISFGLDD